MGFPSYGGASCALAGVDSAIAGNEIASAAASDIQALENLLSGDGKENTSCRMDRSRWGRGPGGDRAALARLGAEAIGDGASEPGG